jgi:hypothetical protein
MLDFVTCKHCSETGTCSNGADGRSCARCRAHWISRDEAYKPKDEETGLVCSVCWGKGVTEPTSSKWQNRFTPVLASGFVVLAFFLVILFGALKLPEFDKVLVFASTLIGSITGYYFGGERGMGKVPASAKAPAQRNKPSPTSTAA